MLDAAAATAAEAAAIGRPGKRRPDRIGFEGIDVRLENLEGGYTVCFESHTADADLADLPGPARRPSPASPLGLRDKGEGAFRFLHREETYEAGDAYYVPPGHTPVHSAGAEMSGV